MKKRLVCLALALLMVLPLILASCGDELTPEEIANAIKAVDISGGYNSRAKIKELDENFKEDLKKLLGNCL